MRDCIYNQLVADDEILILDFDGVFVDSLEMKGKVFSNLFKDINSSKSEQILKHHFKNPALDRFQKIRTYSSWFYDNPLNKEDLKKLSSEFSNKVLEELLKIEPSKFILGLLKTRFDKKNYISTKSTYYEVMKYLAHFSLNEFISEVFDNQIEKKDAIKKISKKNKINSHKIVFIGDSLEDKNSADESGCNFIYYKTGIFRCEDKFFK